MADERVVVMEPVATGSKRKKELSDLHSPSKRRRSVPAQPIPTSPANSRSSTPGTSPERDRISRYSTDTSLLVLSSNQEEQFRSNSEKSGEEPDSLACKERETSLSNNPVNNSEEESAPSVPAAEEIEEFFTAAEKAQKQRFREKYNYDVDDDVPLEGRYQWVAFEA